MQNIQNTNELVNVFTFTRGYFPIKYRLAGFDYKDLDNFTSFRTSDLQKPFPQDFIDNVMLGDFGNFTLKTYYGITVSLGGTATPNGTGVYPANASMVAAMRAWLLARYGGELANFDMSINVLARDLMEEANKNYIYPTANIVSATQKKNLELFGLTTKADPIRVKSIKFSDVGSNSRAQYEENMIYFQTAGDTEIKQKIKPSIGRSAKDKNTEVLTITPTKEMVLDGLRDLDVNVIGDEIFYNSFVASRLFALERVKYFLNGSSPILFFDATSIGIPPPVSLLVLPFPNPPALNLENGVTLTVIFEKVRPDFTFKTQKRLINTLKPTFVPTLAPAITPVVMQEQIKLNAFDETESTEIAPKNNIFAIVAIVLILLVGVVIVGES